MSKSKPQGIAKSKQTKASSTNGKRPKRRARFVKMMVQPHVVIEEDGEIVDDGGIQPFPVSAEQVRDGWTFDIDAFEEQVTTQLNEQLQAERADAD